MDINGIKIKAAIFDLDGTIADSLDVWSRIDEEFFAGYGMELPDDYQDTVKSMDFENAAEYTKQLLGLALGESEIIAKWNAMSKHEYAFNIPLKAGAREYLLALSSAGVKLGLATASGSELFGPLLKRHGVYDLFQSFVTTARAGKDKNSPDVYLLCAKELGCEPGRCMVYEDILAGVISAKSVGMKVTGVYDRYSSKDRGKIAAAADYYIEDFRDALRNLQYN